MRNRFGKWLSDNEQKYPKLILLSGDIGFGIFDHFRQKSPDKFINCGIAEQNMIGVAAGLAAQGFQPIVYTIIPFLLYRSYDFVRNLIAHQKMKVILVGVGGGFSYDNLGFTHYSVEDLAIAQTLPNMEIYTPHDPNTVETCLNDAIRIDRPSYIRLMKGGEKELNGDSSMGLTLLADFGEDFIIYSHGSIVTEASRAVKFLNSEYSINGKLYGVWKYSECEKRIMKEKKNVFFLEEHIYPGIFSKCSSDETTYFTVEKNLNTKVRTRNEILEMHKLSGNQIVNRILSIFKNE